jgi:hypothetical protein
MVSTHLATFKNITQGKWPFCGYFCSISEVPVSGINGLNGDAGGSRFPKPRFPDCPDLAILDLPIPACPDLVISTDLYFSMPACPPISRPSDPCLPLPMYPTSSQVIPDWREISHAALWKFAASQPVIVSERRSLPGAERSKSRSLPPPAVPTFVSALARRPLSA